MINKEKFLEACKIANIDILNRNTEEILFYNVNNNKIQSFGLNKCYDSIDINLNLLNNFINQYNKENYENIIVHIHPNYCLPSSNDIKIFQGIAAISKIFPTHIKDCIILSQNELNFYTKTKEFISYFSMKESNLGFNDYNNIKQHFLSFTNYIINDIIVNKDIQQEIINYENAQINLIEKENIMDNEYLTSLRNNLCNRIIKNIYNATNIEDLNNATRYKVNNNNIVGKDFINIEIAENPIKPTEYIYKDIKKSILDYLITKEYNENFSIKNRYGNNEYQEIVNDANRDYEMYKNDKKITTVKQNIINQIYQNKDKAYKELKKINIKFNGMPLHNQTHYINSFDMNIKDFANFLRIKKDNIDMVKKEIEQETINADTITLHNFHSYHENNTILSHNRGNADVKIEINWTMLHNVEFQDYGIIKNFINKDIFNINKEESAKIQETIAKIEKCFELNEFEINKDEKGYYINWLNKNNNYSQYNKIVFEEIFKDYIEETYTNKTTLKEILIDISEKPSELMNYAIFKCKYRLEETKQIKDIKAEARYQINSRNIFINENTENKEFAFCR